MEDLYDKILVTNIQRFSLHDGPGIRTTVFLKGCSLKCPWCANPENLKPYQEKYIKNGIISTYGKYMSCEEIYDEVIKDKNFYIEVSHSMTNNYLESLPGGITFSGGEALLQVEKIIPLLKRLKREQIHMVAETSLFLEKTKLQIALDYIDLFYVDIKILNKRLCDEIIHGKLDIYYENIDLLMKNGTDVVFRIPIIPGYTDTDKNRREILNFLYKYKPLKVELLVGHNLGIAKYQTLGLKPLILHDVSSEYLEMYKELISRSGILCEICKM